MDALKELKLPDPKIVLRVHNKTPKELWEKSFQCLEEGLGYPLFSNDEVIISSLTNFGYLVEDAYDYVTSACWEPLIPGKSMDQNNVANLNFLEPLMRTLKTVSIEKKEFNDFNSFLSFYQEFLEDYVKETIKTLDNINFEPSPLLSLLVDDCVDNCLDISCGGAKYNNFGLLTVGMGNTINSLLNIKKIVFEESKINLSDIYSILCDNFRHNNVLRVELMNKGVKYGMDESIVIDLTNELIVMVQTTLNEYKNNYGAKYKFGLSSPGFISGSAGFYGSFDGRMFNEPFGVHISPINTSNISYTEISNFASSLCYDQAFNGGVVDIMIERSFLKNNKDNFLDYLKTSFSKGVMQMQINVLNPSTLIKARDDPKLYPDLIVRVWGFSAYFNDLPDEYKDLIIKRALEYESQNHQYTTV
jgi:pyruvate-formate lyase